MRAKNLLMYAVSVPAFLLPLFLALVPYSASAQESFSGGSTNSETAGFGAGRPFIPSAEELARAQSRSREVMGRIPEPGLLEQQYGGGMPRIQAIPKPTAKAPDIAELARQYKTLGRAPVAGKQGPDLLVMVSLSMPREALVRLADQAERAGAVLVFRGLKGDSMRQMGEEIKAITGERNVSAVVHPPAFQQFSIHRVPAVIIAQPNAGSVLDSGCSRAETFVKVSGDVSLDHALEYIERGSPVWADVAKSFRAQIIRGIQ